MDKTDFPKEGFQKQPTDDGDGIDSCPDMDEYVAKLLDSDDDSSKALERYDTGDPQFLQHAIHDMRQLDVLLQERFHREARVRRQRQRHLRGVRHALSEAGLREGEGRLEADNTRKFLSTTVLPEEMDTPTTGTSRSEGSLSVPQRITESDLEECDDWPLVPVEETDNFDEPGVVEEAPEPLPKVTNTPEAKAPMFSFNFDAVLPKIDHVKRNIQCAGRYYTPEEESRLQELLLPPDESGSLTAFSATNPFEVIDADLRALRNIEESLNAIRCKGHPVPEVIPDDASSSDTLAPEQLPFGFYQSAREENEAVRRRFVEITDRLEAIETQEQLMLSRVLEGGEVGPLAERAGIEDALQSAKEELMLKIREGGEELDTSSTEELPVPGQGMAMVPFVTEKQLQLLLGPVPRLGRATTTYSATAMDTWRGWLQEREASVTFLGTLGQETETGHGEREAVAAVGAMEERFRGLVEEVQGVAAQVEQLMQESRGFYDECQRQQSQTDGHRVDQ